MHQTFYIDIEEEISSIVDRLSKSMSTDNYFVVPKRALFLQSVVNLKLLKREAEKVGKKIFVVTQDEIGASMAERCGIEVLENLEELEPVNDVKKNYAEEESFEMEKPIILKPNDNDKIMRLSGVGSSDFFDSNDVMHEKRIESMGKPKNAISPRHVVVDQAASLEKKSKPLIRSSAKSFEGIKVESRGGYHKESSYSGQLDPGKAKTLEKMFSHEKDQIKPRIQPSPAREGRIKKAIAIFSVFCLLAFAGIAAYLFVPSAKIIVTPNILKDKIDLNLHGSLDAKQVEQSSIPLKIIDKDASLSLSYDVAGMNAISGKKAHGTVVIYNEYDSNPQTLIATTRLESENGKIFRIQKNVVVPGKTTIGGEVKPGAVSVDVVADQAGSDFNLDPMKFNIPGFKDSPKYDKFYAKSSETMIGGTSDGKSTGGAVTQRDIDNAKQKTEAALNDKINQDIKDQLGDSGTSLPQGQKITITKSAAAARVGDMVSSFDYVVTASVHALAFSESDVKNSITQSIKDSGLGNVKKEVSKIEYGTVDADFDKNTLDLRIHAEITATPIIDAEQIKKELLGKNDDQLSGILRKYTSIKNVNFEFSPSFISRLPQYEQRVSIEIKPENQ